MQAAHRELFFFFLRRSPAALIRGAQQHRHPCSAAAAVGATDNTDVTFVGTQIVSAFASGAGPLPLSNYLPRLGVCPNIRVKMGRGGLLRGLFRIVVWQGGGDTLGFWDSSNVAYYSSKTPRCAERGRYLMCRHRSHQPLHVLLLKVTC